MKKNFKLWHIKKTYINDIHKLPFFHEREIWFCYLGANVGFEQDGNENEFMRPILIIKKFNNSIFWAVPLSKAHAKISKRNNQYYYTFSFIKGITSVALLSQIRLLDGRRLSRHIGNIDEKEYNRLIQKLKALLP